MVARRVARHAPKGEWVRAVENTGKRFERRHGPEIDGDVLGVVFDRTPVHDLDIEARQPRGRPRGVGVVRFNTLLHVRKTPFSTLSLLA